MHYINIRSRPEFPAQEDGKYSRDVTERSDNADTDIKHNETPPSRVRNGVQLLMVTRGRYRLIISHHPETGSAFTVTALSGQ